MRRSLFPLISRLHIGAHRLPSTWSAPGLARWPSTVRSGSLRQGRAWAVRWGGAAPPPSLTRSSGQGKAPAARWAARAGRGGGSSFSHELA